MITIKEAHKYLGDQLDLKGIDPNLNILVEIVELTDEYREYQSGASEEERLQLSLYYIRPSNGLLGSLDFCFTTQKDLDHIAGTIKAALFNETNNYTT